MKIIVGLGNPGAFYAYSRHNAGFIIVDKLRQEFNFKDFSVDKTHNILISPGKISGQDVVFIQPQTFMNRTGLAVASISAAYDISPENILVIHDDLNLPFKKLRFRRNGVSVGHNGVKSIIHELRSDAFCRLRFGVKPLVPFKKDVSEYVLQSFTKQEFLSIDVEDIKTFVLSWL